MEEASKYIKTLEQRVKELEDDIVQMRSQLRGYQKMTDWPQSDGATSAGKVEGRKARGVQNTEVEPTRKGIDGMVEKEVEAEEEEDRKTAAEEDGGYRIKRKGTERLKLNYVE
jgi:hypothetical protein